MVVVSNVLIFLLLLNLIVPMRKISMKPRFLRQQISLFPLVSRLLVINILTLTYDDFPIFLGRCLLTTSSRTPGR